MADSSTTTCGSFDTEALACAYFDAVCKGDAMARLFSLYPEVDGTPLDLSRDRELKDYRIDRVLIPTRQAILNGWDIGAVGIEIKASGTDIGKALAQCMDYQRSIWETPSGFHYRLRWVFLFPCRQVVGAAAALMANGHVGYAYSGNGSWDSKETMLVLGCGCLNPLTVERDGNTVTVNIRGAGSICCRRGSR
jgi:hypothetical protein